MNHPTNQATQTRRALATETDTMIEAPIQIEAETLTQGAIDAFAAATRSEFFKTCPPTFATTFRRAEFMWLERLGVDMRQLLHTDQEYEFHADLAVGDQPVITTSKSEDRERRGLWFVTLESTVVCGGVLKITSRSAFVVRRAAGKGEA